MGILKVVTGTVKPNGETALMAARLPDHVDDKVVEALIASGANKKMATRDGSTALIFAARSGQTDVARLQLSLGASGDGHMEAL